MVSILKSVKRWIDPSSMNVILVVLLLISGCNLYLSYSHYCYYTKIEIATIEFSSEREKLMTFSNALKSERYQEFFQKFPILAKVMKSSADYEESVTRSINVVIKNGIRKSTLALFLDLMQFIGILFALVFLNRKNINTGKSVP